MSKNNKNIENPTPTTPAVSNGIGSSVLALSVVIALLLGLIAGFFIGENRTTAKYEKLIEAGVYTSTTNNNNNNSSSGDNNNSNDQSGDSSEFDKDYTGYKINSTTTVQNYYSDNETRYYASNIIGKELPEFKWTDSAGVAHSTKEYAEGKYILEFFMSTCAYCNSTIPEITSFRNNTNNTIISLSFDTGDISNFNKDGEHAFHIDNMSDSAATAFSNNLPWVPAILYIEDNIVKLVTFGGTTESDITTAWDVAFAG